MACELSSTCPYFTEQTRIPPQVAVHFRAKYCRSDYTECARYLVFTARGLDGIPPDLAPNDRLKALRLLREHPATNCIDDA